MPHLTTADCKNMDGTLWKRCVYARLGDQNVLLGWKEGATGKWVASNGYSRSLSEKPIGTPLNSDFVDPKIIDAARGVWKSMQDEARAYVNSGDKSPPSWQAELAFVESLADRIRRIVQMQDLIHTLVDTATFTTDHPDLQPPPPIWSADALYGMGDAIDGSLDAMRKEHANAS